MGNREAAASRRRRRRERKRMEGAKKQEFEERRFLTAEQLESLEINPGYKEQFLQLARKLNRYEKMAALAEDDNDRDRYASLFLMLERKGVVNKEFTDEVCALGKAIMEAYHSEQNGKASHSAEHIQSRGEFNSQLHQLRIAIKDMPLMKLVMEEAGFMAFEQEVESAVDRDEDPTNLKLVKISGPNTPYAGIATARNMYQPLTLVDAVISKDFRDSSFADESWQNIRRIFFKSTENGNNSHYREATLRNSQGRELLKAQVHIVKAQSPFEIARCELFCHQQRVVVSVSRLTGEICPVSGCIYDLKGVFSMTYDIVKNLIYNAINSAMEQGLFKEAMPNAELPSIHLRQFISALEKLGVNLIERQEDFAWEKDDKTVPAWHKGETVYITSDQIKKYLSVFDIKFYDFISQLPPAPKRLYQSIYGE